MTGMAHKAPAGTFIIGEAFYSENEWNRVGGYYNQLAKAKKAADTLNASKAPEFDYFVYDDQGRIVHMPPKP